uniref:CHHC U11-48K-type domain-containing protein n=1 Tax=Timema bartmani TaxID=61472 RepID=A0A7R9ET86_9NEOP|nr:unnamed protein product [Timema bartmani]
MEPRWRTTEPLVICPYDRSHMILESRIQMHLIKCARNHPGVMLEVCPHNASHRFRDYEKYEQHVKICPNQRLPGKVKLTLEEKYIKGGYIEKISSLTTRPQEDRVDEDWERDHNGGPAASTHGLVHPEQEVLRNRLDTGEESCSKDVNESSDKEVHWMDKIILSRDSQDIKDSAKPSRSTTSPKFDFGDDSEDFEKIWESGICLGRGNRPVWMTKKEETKVARVREVSSDAEEDNLQQGFGRGVLRERYRSAPHPPVLLGRGSGACFDSFYT